MRARVEAIDATDRNYQNSIRIWRSVTRSKHNESQSSHISKFFQNDAVKRCDDLCIFELSLNRLEGALGGLDLGTSLGDIFGSIPSFEGIQGLSLGDLFRSSFSCEQSEILLLLFDFSLGLGES
jgi:hypothetical protein